MVMVILRAVDDASRSDSTKIQTRMDDSYLLGRPLEAVREPGMVDNKEDYINSKRRIPERMASAVIIGRRPR